MPNSLQAGLLFTSIYFNVTINVNISHYNVYLYLLIKKSNCQTFKPVLVYIPLYCINSLGPNFWVFESLHKEKYINSTRKRVQSAIQRIFHRKPAQI
jgi:hypothetical protein